MTETEWLACTDPKLMLQFVVLNNASDRKLRLFGVACCRRIWDWIGENSRHAIDVFERYADGQATKEELNAAETKAAEEWFNPDSWGSHHPSNAACCLGQFGYHSPHDAVAGAAAEVAEAVWCESANCVFRSGGTPSPKTVEDQAKAKLSEHVAQCHLLRDIFHGPRRSVLVRNSWKSPAVVDLAWQIYVERAFYRFSDLAGALEEAGCQDHSVLDHCLEQGPHVRGCWVLDVLLGKN